jgi:hypothetical protein
MGCAIEDFEAFWLFPITSNMLLRSWLGFAGIAKNLPASVPADALSPASALKAALTRAVWHWPRVLQRYKPAAALCVTQALPELF